jgi:hypothetical protein
VSKRLEDAAMSGASDHMHKKGDTPTPRRREARISPELDEVLRMLKALEEQPPADTGSDRSR